MSEKEWTYLPQLSNAMTEEYHTRVSVRCNARRTQCETRITQRRLQCERGVKLRCRRSCGISNLRKRRPVPRETGAYQIEVPGPVDGVETLRMGGHKPRRKRSIQIRSGSTGGRGSHPFIPPPPSLLENDFCPPPKEFDQLDPPFSSGVNPPGGGGRGSHPTIPS